MSCACSRGRSRSALSQVKTSSGGSCKEIGGSAIQADLTKEEDVLNLFKQIENLHGLGLLCETLVNTN